MDGLSKKTVPDQEDAEVLSSKHQRISKDSDAAKFNKSALKKLQRALEKDPEADLLAALPAGYSSRLAARKETVEKREENVPADRTVRTEDNNITLDTTTELRATIVYPLSEAMENYLQFKTPSVSANDDGQLAIALQRALRDVDIIWKSTMSGMRRFVARLTQDIVVKSCIETDEYTEYTTLQYLKANKPEIPVPEPHGVVKYGGQVLIFMSYVPGTTLEKAWLEMNSFQKAEMRDALDEIFTNLRSIECPPNTQLGGVAGEGCKDTRRHTRLSEKPLYTTDDFFSFQLGHARCAGKYYLDWLRELTRPLYASKCVFTHGDIRTANIMVQARGGKYFVTGIIDWEMSGFYPEDFECTKVTNVFGTSCSDDWFSYLPQSISPAKYPAKWLADWLWDIYVV